MLGCIHVIDGFHFIEIPAIAKPHQILIKYWIGKLNAGSYPEVAVYSYNRTVVEEIAHKIIFRIYELDAIQVIWTRDM